MSNKITSDEWNKRGETLFGKERLNWLFQCPKCKNVQTAKDFLKFKNKGIAPSGAFLVCVKKFSVGDNVNTCNCTSTDTGLELFKVINPQNVEIPVFPFYEIKNPETL